MHAKRIGQYLDATSGLGRLTSQAACLLAIRQVFAGALPAPVRQSCAIANYKQGKVIVLAESSAVAARLRILAPSLVALLGERGLNVTGLKIEVQPDARPRVQVTEKKNLLLSAAAASALERAARQLSDGELKRVVGALARRGRR
jgi:hypothetical protein